MSIIILGTLNRFSEIHGFLGPILQHQGDSAIFP